MNASEVNAVQATINHVNLLNRFNYLTEGMDDWKMWRYAYAFPQNISMNTTRNRLL